MYAEQMKKCLPVGLMLALCHVQSKSIKNCTGSALDYITNTVLILKT